VLTSDVGGVVSAARKPLVGADRLARATKVLRGIEFEFVDVNGMPGLRGEGGSATNVLAFTVDAGRIIAIDVMRNPQKLQRRALTQ
jgi:RNA polymerase sigma-70 factor, ECF subfamily